MLATALGERLVVQVLRLTDKPPAWWCSSWF